MKHIIAIVLFVSIFSAEAFSQDTDAELSGNGHIFASPEFPVLKAGETVNGTINTSDGNPYVTYRLTVPENASRIQLAIEGASYDLDMYLKRGSEILDYNEADYYGKSDDFNELLVIDRFSTPPLAPGEYFLDVTYQWEETPELDGYPEGIIPFSLTYGYDEPEVRAKLIPGNPHRDVLTEDGGMFGLYMVEVPEHSRFLRFDIYDTISDLDLLVRYENPNVSLKEYDYKAESLASREFLTISPNSGLYLKAGTYYVMVFDQVSTSISEEFSVLASFSDQPPRELLGIPGIPHQGTPLETCLSATVEITGSATRGSGVLVSADGYILTNWHVVRADDGAPSQSVSVAVSLDFFNPPEELFRAKVLKYDEKSDLALLKIDTGYYGQAIPAGYVFPYFELSTNDRVTIGQPISVIGFPDVGGSGSRVSVTLTKGIISGLMKFYGGYLYKTDAEINPGNSGGAVVNAFYELIGLPTTIVGDSSGKLGFIHPVSLLPPSWLMLISGH